MSTATITGRGNEKLAVQRVRLQVAPLTGEELWQWHALFARLPAAERVEIERFDGQMITLEIETTSMSRLHAQMRHLEATVQAVFTPTMDGVLGFRLRPAGSRAWAGGRLGDDRHLSAEAQARLAAYSRLAGARDAKRPTRSRFGLGWLTGLRGAARAI